MWRRLVRATDGGEPGQRGRGRGVARPMVAGRDDGGVAFAKLTVAGRDEGAGGDDEKPVQQIQSPDLPREQPRFAKAHTRSLAELFLKRSGSHRESTKSL